VRSFEDFASVATAQEGGKDYNKATSVLVGRVLERHAPVVRAFPRPTTPSGLNAKKGVTRSP